MNDLTIAITAASYSGNKGAAAMLQSSIRQLHRKYGESLNISLMSVYPGEDRLQNPWDFVTIVPCTPQKLLFIAFPLAILYRLFFWFPPIRALLLKNKILKAYSKVDAVLDEAGISFVDSRGFVMNTYAFVCAAVPMLMGKPVMKYSQALGTFKSPMNKFLAKWILPKMKLICARGKMTEENLYGIGIRDNVKLCADGAFTMEDDEACRRKVEEVRGRDAFYRTDHLVGLSISSVVDKKCRKQGIDYPAIMVEFIDALNKQGYPVLMIANAARIHSEKPRNNDLMVGDKIFEAVGNKDMVRWYHSEMDAEEIREYIAGCRYLVASRFHAMIGALQKKVPVLLVGWSHKYQEVLDFFQLGQYAIDFSNLSAASLMEEFHRFAASEEEIRQKLDENYDAVMDSSRKNIEYVSRILDDILEKKSNKPCKKFLDLTHPGTHIGPYLQLKKTYATDETIRENAASGGTVTAFLCHLLKTGQIDGAWVSRTKVENGELDYETLIATDEQQIRDCSSSVYMSIPMMKHLQMLRDFPGKVAVVMVPCQLRALSAVLEKEPELAEKVVLRIGLYCSGNHDKAATLTSLKQANIPLEGASRLYYRKGHWRGQSVMQYADGTEKTFSYTKTICAYKNAYFYEQGSCMYCQDHYGLAADLSFGDIWLKEMKKDPIKYSSTVIRSQKAADLMKEACDAGQIKAFHISGRDMVRSQKRALVFKYTLAKAKNEQLRKEGKQAQLTEMPVCRWNHRLAWKLAQKNHAYSVQHPEKLEKIPHMLIYYYMCLIRVLLSF